MAATVRGAVLLRPMAGAAGRLARMPVSRLLTSLVVAVSLVGAGGVATGCGASDVSNSIPGVKDAKKQAQKAIDDARKQSEQTIKDAQAQLDKAQKEVDKAPSADQKKQAQSAVDAAQTQLDNAETQGKALLDQAQKALDKLD
jgi:vacuolar-type H+-ATPase subunit H